MPSLRPSSGTPGPSFVLDARGARVREPLLELCFEADRAQPVGEEARAQLAQRASGDERLLGGAAAPPAPPRPRRPRPSPRAAASFSIQKVSVRSSRASSPPRRAPLERRRLRLLRRQLAHQRLDLREAVGGGGRRGGRPRAGATPPALPTARPASRGARPRAPEPPSAQLPPISAPSGALFDQKDSRRRQHGELAGGAAHGGRAAPARGGAAVAPRRCRRAARGGWRASRGRGRGRGGM